MHLRIAFLLLTTCLGCNVSCQKSAQPPPPPDVTVISREHDKFVEVPVLFGTDRTRTGLDDPARFFSGKRGETLQLGRALVSIPRSHETGELETPRWWRFWNRTAADEFVLLASIELFSESEFIQASRDEFERAGATDVLLFVHGYANTFADAARRAAQIAFDLKFPGVAAVYSWPSEGDVKRYTVDDASVSATTEHLRAFIDLLRNRSGAKRMHLVAHSMGSRALLETLALFAHEAQAPGGALIQHVIFAAPDVDAQRFSNLITLVRPAALNVTLYASSNDRALKASAAIHGWQLAGQTIPRPLVMDGVFTIDASDADTDFLGHSYVGQAAIIDDMFYLLRNQNDDPKSRARMNAVTMPDGKTYWKYK